MCTGFCALTSGRELCEAVACVQQRVRGIGLRSRSFRENKRGAYILARAHNMSLYVEVGASHQGCEVVETVAGMRVPWEGWACSQRLGLRGSSSVRACSGKRRQLRNRQRIALKCDTQNKHITGTGAHLTSVANSDTGAGMLRRAATLGQERGGGAWRQRQRTPAIQQAVPVACNRQRIALKCDTQNKHKTGTGAHLTSVANSDTGAGMLWRQATLEQARGCGDSDGGGGGGGGGGSGGASSRGSGGKEACDAGSGSAMTSKAACGATPGRGC